MSTRLLLSLAAALALVGCEVAESFCRCADARLQVEAACAEAFNACIAVAAVQAGAELLELGRAAAERTHDERVEFCGENWAACVGEVSR